MEETLGNLSAFYAMFPGNQKFNVFPLWLAEDHHARLSVFAPQIGHPHSEDLDSEYLNIFETRTRTPFFQTFMWMASGSCSSSDRPGMGKYIGLDPLGTTGLATNVNHGYLQAFGAVGGLDGLAQIGKRRKYPVFIHADSEWISEQSATEGEQVLNHFFNRLPIITLKEGSRTSLYIGRDILIPSYAEHRVDPTL